MPRERCGWSSLQTWMHPLAPQAHVAPVAPMAPGARVAPALAPMALAQWPQGQASWPLELGRAMSIAPGDIEWLTAHPMSEPDLSSIHVLSPAAPRKDECKEDEEFRDPTKLVAQLASLVKGLQADADSLRRENMSLRQSLVPTKTSSRAISGSSWAEVPERASALSSRSTPQVSQAHGDFVSVHSSPHFGVPQARTPSPNRTPVPSAAGQPLGGSRGPTLATAMSPQTDISPTLESMPLGSDSRQEDGWAADQAFWLGGEGSVEKLAGKVFFLDKSLVISLSAAVDGLNLSTFKCTEDACVVYSASSQGYYLLYRVGCKDKAFNLAVGCEMPPCRDEVTEDMTTLTDTSSRSQSRRHNRSVVSRSAILAAPPDGRGFTREESPLLELQSSELENLRLQDAGALAQDFRGEVHEVVSPAAAHEEAVLQALRSGLQVPEDSYDTFIAIYSQEGNEAKAEEWLWRALDASVVPNEVSFKMVIMAGCRQWNCDKVEETMQQMLRLRIRPSKEVFNIVIRMFAELGEALKVEEWLLNAGQSGWTPEQAAFDSAVLLFAEQNAFKAEEWLSRARQTEYKFPDACFDAVAQAFLREGNYKKASEWLTHMLADNRPPCDANLQEAVAQGCEAADVKTAEVWLDQLTKRGSAPDALRLAVIDAACRSSDLECSERQLVALAEPEPERCSWVAGALAEIGHIERAKQLLQNFVAAGGMLTAKIGAQLLSYCAALQDAQGAEAAARALSVMAPLSEQQVHLLCHCLGAERTEGLLNVLGDGAFPREEEAPTASRRTTMEAAERSGTSSPGVPPRQKPLASSIVRTTVNSAASVPKPPPVVKSPSAAKAVAPVRRSLPASSSNTTGRGRPFSAIR